jgi:hypothetical protein
MSIGARYPDLPIRHKLRLIVMATVGAALIVACGAVLVTTTRCATACGAISGCWRR